MADAFANLSAALVKAVVSASPAVVRVEARRRFPASGFVWSADGIILAASHAVQREDNPTVGLHGGASLNAAFLGRDENTDLAVLRVQSSDLQPLAPAGEIQVGQLALALARPAEGVQASLGMVSALGKDFRAWGGARLEGFLRAEVTLYPGFSGGPLVDSAGRLIGMNTSALLRGEPLTIMTALLARQVEAILAHGRVRRGFLGVGSQPVRLPPALASQLGQETGLLLVSVEPGSPADKAGLLLGDVLVALEDAPIRHPADLLAALSSDRVGQEVSLRLLRGGELKTMKVVVGER